MGSLGLVLGVPERKAMRLRNISAHGKNDEVDIEWIRDPHECSYATASVCSGGTRIQIDHKTTARWRT